VPPLPCRPLLISDGRETPARPVDMTARGDTSKSLRPFRGECKDAAAHCRGGGQMCFWKGGEGEASEYVGGKVHRETWGIGSQ